MKSAGFLTVVVTLIAFVTFAADGTEVAIRGADRPQADNDGVAVRTR